MGEAKRKALILRKRREWCKKAFPPGTWVFGIGPHKGCSEVLEFGNGSLQPFDYLNDYDISHFRVATPAEVMEAMERVMGVRIGKMEGVQ
jgi:hypothetical protein